MAMKKVYDADEILKMSVGLMEPDIDNADYNGDGKISATDARTNKRIDSGLSIDTPVIGNTGVTAPGNTNANNIYAASNAYQNQADAIYKKIQETPDFKYDFNEDAVFKALQEQYMKDGKLAAENIAGQAAALSGGYSNSYGATAAGQAYMGAIDDLYDVVPELEDIAYSRFRDEKTDQLQNWQILQDRADRERAYAQDERAYKDSQDALLWEMAMQQAQLGDYSALKNLGVDTKNSEYALNLSNALQLAQIGDYSGLEALGIDVSNAKKQNELDFALAAAEFGDYSFLKAMGIDISALEAPKYIYYSSGGSDNNENESNGAEGNGIVPNPFTGDLPKKSVLTMPTAAEKQFQKVTGLGKETDFVDDMIDKWQYTAYDDKNATKKEKETALGYLTLYGGKLY